MISNKFKAGARSSLRRSHEIADLGDVRGKELIHLQCHWGKDTLSWARLGAHVTGLDFSEAAVRAAVALAADIGIDARFVTADVYDAPEALGGRTFDIVYTGVGALCWLPDIARWAKVAFNLLSLAVNFICTSSTPSSGSLEKPTSPKLSTPISRRRKAFGLPA